MCATDKENGDIYFRELADRLKISNGAVYYILKALTEKRYVKAKNFQNNSKNHAIFMGSHLQVSARIRGLLPSFFGKEGRILCVESRN